MAAFACSRRNVGDSSLYQLLSLTLLVVAALVPAASGVGPGGDVLEEGCEELQYEDTTNHTKYYEVLTVHFNEVAIPLVIAIWILIAAIAKVLFHFSPLPKYVPESCLLIAIGFALGGLFLLNRNSVFNAELGSHMFFLYLLPPIMMEAGYFMPMEAFWSNIGSILMFAVVGTLINAFSIGLSLWGISEGGLLGTNKTINILECMTFSSLISAVDPVAVLAVFEEIHVNQVLHILVFGESLLNDAVTVVLYRVFETFNEIGQDNLVVRDVILGIVSFFVVAFGGILVGLAMGFMTAFITKYTYRVRVIEPVFVFVMAYLSYIIAEMLTLSSILAIVFCSMFMKPYVEQNISQKSHTTIKYFLKMMSSISETIIFIFLGTTSLEAKENHEWNTAFVLFTLVFCFVYRSIGVIVQVKILNQFRLFKINRRSQFIMAYGGIRGAIAFSLVALLCSHVIKAKPIFFTTTVVVIMFTVFFQGMTIKPLVNYLHVKKAEKRKPTMNEEIYERFNGHLMSGVEEIIGHHGHHSLKEKWEYLNEKYLERILLREQKKARNHQILDVYSKLASKDALELVKENKLFPTSSSADLLALPKSSSESHLLSESSSHLEVPGSDPSLRQRNAGGGGDVESTGGEDPAQAGGGLSRQRRKSSFQMHLDAFKKNAFKPRQSHTVRQSRHYLADEDINEPRLHVGRSLHILARHKTRKIRRQQRSGAGEGVNGRRHSASKFMNMIRNRSSGNMEERTAAAATKDESKEATAEVNGEPSVGVADTAPDQVKFSVEDEQSKQERETEF
ncbi:probable Na(+)/H(+) antiporter nhx-9 [Diadema antillarum]|uniref:probable Na(+)/H(+) antiporter nhx-9 n=1 Tax=Diadema antillarum TaxID=105358 RepID=UPI003A8C0FA6